MHANRDMGRTAIFCWDCGALLYFWFAWATAGVGSAAAGLGVSGVFLGEELFVEVQAGECDDGGDYGCFDDCAHLDKSELT